MHILISVTTTEGGITYAWDALERFYMEAFFPLVSQR